MNQIFTSASKIVFILMALAVCVALFIGKVEPKDFMTLAVMAFSFYFTKSVPSVDDTQTTSNNSNEIPQS